MMPVFVCEPRVRKDAPASNCEERMSNRTRPHLTPDHLALRQTASSPSALKITSRQNNWSNEQVASTALPAQGCTEHRWTEADATNHPLQSDAAIASRDLAT
ncbi:hypothetical protein HPB47_010984 [Ixodes persulcatus]|uniref:Uncharacterized protein n=1 Tax=Ixodes persulcatus TaxID=34615 RepID=A0AC60NXM6_IXOPE|nr:hypothetical protein HPB47_010984 [Ixodes persulcatus]